MTFSSILKEILFWTLLSPILILFLPFWLYSEIKEYRAKRKLYKFMPKKEANLLWSTTALGIHNGVVHYSSDRAFNMVETKHNEFLARQEELKQRAELDALFEEVLTNE